MDWDFSALRAMMYMCEGLVVAACLLVVVVKVVLVVVWIGWVVCACWRAWCLAFWLGEARKVL
jgi:hypothetical protein